MKDLQEDISDCIAENEVKFIFLKQILKKTHHPIKNFLETCIVLILEGLISNID